MTWQSRKCSMVLGKTVKEVAKCPHFVDPREALSFDRNWVTPSTLAQISTSGWDIALFSND